MVFMNKKIDYFERKKERKKERTDFFNHNESLWDLKRTDNETITSTKCLLPIYGEYLQWKKNFLKRKLNPLAA